MFAVAGEKCEELARRLEFGAKRSDIVGSGSWIVLEDPEGNEFCLMSKRIPAELAPLHDAQKMGPSRRTLTGKSVYATMPVACCSAT